jgi:hypothetical protein
MTIPHSRNTYSVMNKKRQCTEISNLKDDGLIHCQPSHNKASLGGSFIWISFALNTMTHQ